MAPNPTRPAFLLRAEGAAALAASTLLYRHEGGSWLLFALLLLAPDLSAVGYLFGPQAGTAAYNLAHTYTLPLALVAAGAWFGIDLVPSLALIWLAHIAMDRLAGYGLKYTGGFKDTHLGRV
jgi:hypothetical protein